jgi:alpha-glucosidase
MDIKINDSAATSTGSTLEYNVVGGVLDFYFFAGSTSQPAVVAQQYAELAGTPAEVPYWSFGLHQCRFGYQSQSPWSILDVSRLTDSPTDYIDVAQVIMNYSAAGIPLETMWTDIGPTLFPLAFRPSLIRSQTTCTSAECSPSTRNTSR